MNNDAPSIDISGQMAWNLLALANETDTDLVKMVNKILTDGIKRERRKLARQRIREFTKRELAKMSK